MMVRWCLSPARASRRRRSWAAILRGVSTPVQAGRREVWEQGESLQMESRGALLEGHSGHSIQRRYFVQFLGG